MGFGRNRFARTRGSRASKGVSYPYKIYYPNPEYYSLNAGNTIQPSVDLKTGDRWYTIASIDPASKNYAIRIEKRYLDGRITPVLFTCLDLTQGTAGQSEYQVLNTFFDQYANYFIPCHLIIFERQLTTNYNMVRMSQHTLSYFLNLLKAVKHTCFIVEIESRIKSNELGGAAGLKGKQLKQWAVDRATELLTWRNDTFSLQVMQERKKKDDLADTVVQAEALCSMWKLPLTKRVEPITLVPKINTKVILALPKQTEYREITLDLTLLREVQASIDDTKTNLAKSIKILEAQPNIRQGTTFNFNPPGGLVSQRSQSTLKLKLVS
jgi:hypothetical protein